MEVPLCVYVPWTVCTGTSTTATRIPGIDSVSCFVTYSRPRHRPWGRRRRRAQQAEVPESGRSERTAAEERLLRTSLNAPIVRSTRLTQPPDWNSTGVGRQATTTDQEQTNEAAKDRHCQEQHKTELGRACRLLRNEREGNEGRAVRRNGCVDEDAVKVPRARRCCGPRCGGRLAGKEQSNQLIG